MPLSAWGLAAGVLSAVLFGLAAVAQARASRRHPDPARLVDFVRHGLRDPLLMLVVAAYLVGFVLHAVAIWWLPLYLAQATVALSLPVTALAAHRVDGRAAGGAWLGVAAVTAGLALLAYASGAAGQVRTDWWLPGALALLLVLLVLTGRSAGRRGPALGWLAGLGYAGSALAVRGVGWPPSPAVLAAAALVPALGLVAFWLYSRGLGRSLVTSATAPMITAQTFVPALVGLALLGDQTRPGWWPAVVVGFGLALAGALAVRPPASVPAVSGPRPSGPRASGPQAS
ncbi:hypothetical protein [Nocardioides campestrisoli]|uniref:hypothetical protein n=1 Tax=Nocardioides campestrisoli TaxID=2736757 RepID=UPI0015E734E9|nr:hypothetical protein [Nocardioides campestrisoli]